MSANELLGRLHRQPRTDKHVPPIVVTLGIAVIGFFLLAALTIAVGALVTHFVVGHGLGRTDENVVRWFVDRRTPTWNDASVVGSYLAESVTVLGVLAFALVWLGIRRRWSQFALLFVSVSVEVGVYVVATNFVTRNRPAVPRLEHRLLTDSFPSGHTGASVALYGALAVCVWSLTTNRWWRAASFALAVLAPVIVATSRMYRGMHHPTDVISGALVGAGCVYVGYVSVRAGLADAREREVDEYPIRPLQTREAA